MSGRRKPQEALGQELESSVELRFSHGLLSPAQPRRACGIVEATHGLTFSRKRRLVSHLHRLHVPFQTGR